MYNFRVQEDPRYGLVHKIASVQLEHDMLGKPLEDALLGYMRDFVRAMEIRGMRLYEHPTIKENPQWVRDEHEDMARWYAMDWVGERPLERDPDGQPMPRSREGSLEDSAGMVEYRCVGIFWAPEYDMEVAKPIQAIKDEERLGKNPILFGYGGSGGRRMTIRDPNEVALERKEGELL